jgi:hypothetical protein
MHMARLYELVNCLVDQAAEPALNGHVHDGWLDVVLGNPLQALRTGVSQHTAAGCDPMSDCR